MVVAEIIYEDEALLVLNKAQGVLMYPYKGHSAPNLIDFLEEKNVTHVGGDDPNRAGIVHRLDLHTEGLVLVSKDQESFEALQKQFKERSIIKKYMAMVYGDIKTDHFSIDWPIGLSKKGGNKRTCSHPKLAREAQTDVEVVRRYFSKTLVRLIPKTGRTHQLRVHMEAYGHPIMGDPLYYGNRKKGSAQLLQAYYLAFFHPKLNKKLEFELPLSDRLLFNKDRGLKK